jgi:hypothetical protein
VASKPNAPVTENQLSRWRLLTEFNRHLANAFVGTKLHPTWVDPQRVLQIGDYLGLFLLGVFNPILTSMRGLCQASQLLRVQEEVCRQPVSKSSFSEAQGVVDPALLKSVYDSLALEVAQRRPTPQKSDNPFVQSMQIVDSTLWYVLPRMHWAVWRQQHGIQRACRLHVKFQVIDDLPAEISLREARRCERLEWEEMIEPGEFCVGDRNYGEDYQQLGRLNGKGCWFAVRLRSDSQWAVQEELPLQQADREAGVVWQGWVRLRKDGTGPRVRVVLIQGEKELLFIATNLTPEQMSAELVSLCYRQRWQIELFFRWLKHLMKANHWMAESEDGVAIQIYLTLIAAQLLLLFSGQRPNKRTFELLQFMAMGWATPEEVLELIKKQQASGKKKKKSH